jgi:hypothetical protein
MKRSDPACSSGSVSSFNIDRSLSRTASNGGEMLVSMTREVQIQVERRRSIAASLSLKEQKSIARVLRGVGGVGLVTMLGIRRANSGETGRGMWWW